MPHPGVEPCEVLLRDDVVVVQVEDVVEEVSELSLLEVRESLSAWQELLVVVLRPLYEGGPGVFHPAGPNPAPLLLLAGGELLHRALAAHDIRIERERFS